jgi:hypothetical protein
MVLIHEMVEHHLCAKRGITQQQVDEFDHDFEQRIEDGEEQKDAEPGDSDKAPYHNEHQFATIIEKMLCHELGYDWSTYIKESGDTK